MSLLDRLLPPWGIFADAEQENWTHGDPRPSQVERWREYEYQLPREHADNHDRVWTGAPGVWYCRDCHAWYRTWKDEPEEPHRQEWGF